MSKQKATTLIVSDIHLGSPVSRAEKLLETLKQWEFETIILLGDVFDDLDLNNLREDHWELLSHLSHLSEKKEVIWIEGNHDKNLSKVMSSLVGIQVYKKYVWKHQNKKCLALHGHQFDRFMLDNVFLSYIASKIYLLMQKLGGKEQKIARYIKRKSKGWLRLSNKVAKSAIFYARLHRADYVFCGHTHFSMEMKQKGVHYFNSGCWTDVPSSMIAMRRSSIEIVKIK
ncbi:MAG: UDP-2,3-diacylglucosamine diphosphatase [Candidatus Moranbacteria bacterium]|nr:UDP-2,3-diacylglucosamine diphosphatase [Candidatus Moranbacteria bacterium]